MMTLEDWKTFFEIIYYIVAILAFAGAAWTYYKNSRLEQSKWASTFYEKFYESDKYKYVRDVLDCEATSQEVAAIVDSEDAKFTDYLNFFEHVAIFTKSKQLHAEDVEDSFGYYLDCLANLEKVRKYINDEKKGYEKLREHLKDRERKAAIAKRS